LNRKLQKGYLREKRERVRMKVENRKDEIIIFESKTLLFFRKLRRFEKYDNFSRGD
jgi:hypothetical protein